VISYLQRCWAIRWIKGPSLGERSRVICRKEWRSIKNKELANLMRSVLQGTWLWLWGGEQGRWGPESQGQRWLKTSAVAKWLKPQEGRSTDNSHLSVGNEDGVVGTTVSLMKRA
jgi:hypothetical protein